MAGRDGCYRLKPLGMTLAPATSGGRNASISAAAEKKMAGAHSTAAKATKWRLAFLPASVTLARRQASGDMKTVNRQRRSRVRISSYQMGSPTLLPLHYHHLRPSHHLPSQTFALVRGRRRRWAVGNDGDIRRTTAGPHTTTPP